MPHKFKDNKGDEWEIALPFGTIMRVRKASDGKFDLLDPFTNDLQGRLHADLVEFWDLLQIITEPQAEARGINAEGFGLRMASNCLLDAMRAFFAEWIEFFRASQRPDVGEALAKIEAVQINAIALLREKCETDPTLAKMANQTSEKVARDLTTAFDTLRVNYESSLTATPGESSTKSTN